MITISDIQEKLIKCGEQIRNAANKPDEPIITVSASGYDLITKHEVEVVSINQCGYTTVITFRKKD